MAETEPKVTQALEKPFTIAIFSDMDSRCLVPFSSNISWDHENKGLSCFDFGSYGIIYSRGRGGGGGQERDIQQENSNTKLVAHKYNSCNSNT
jgi:hypothetical protein